MRRKLDADFSGVFHCRRCRRCRHPPQDPVEVVERGVDRSRQIAGFPHSVAGRLEEYSCRSRIAQRLLKAHAPWEVVSSSSDRLSFWQNTNRQCLSTMRRLGRSIVVDCGVILPRSSSRLPALSLVLRLCSLLSLLSPLSLSLPFSVSLPASRKRTRARPKWSRHLVTKPCGAYRRA